jgi:hypothetical protein
MSDDCPTRQHILEEATISNMWEIAAMAEWRQGLPPPRYFLRVFRPASSDAILAPEHSPMKREEAML